MIQTRSYHGTTIDICAVEDSNKIAYMLLPERLDSEGFKWVERTAVSYNCSIVSITGMDWNNDLTPWIEDGLGKKDLPFGGHAKFYLGTLLKDYFANIENELKVTNASRTLVGVSLSGLFAIWAAHNCDAFTNVISLSGSFWYEGFKDWVLGHKVSDTLYRAFISIGDKEKKNKEPRLCNLLDCTEAIVENMKDKGKHVKYEIEPNTSHFSPIIPRLEKAFEYIYATKLEGGDGDDD